MVTVPLTLALLFPQIWIIDCREKTEAELLSSAEWGRIRLKPEAVGEGGKADRRSLNRAGGGGGPEEGGDGGSGNGTDETGGGGNVTGTGEAGGDRGGHNSTQENPEEAGGGGGGFNETDGNPQEAKEGGSLNGTDVSSQGGGEGESSNGTDGKSQGEGVGSVNGTDREPDQAGDGGTIDDFDDAQAWAKENLWNETVELPIDAGERGNLTIVDLPINGTNTTVDIVDLPIDGTNVTDANETFEEPSVHDNDSLNGTDANSEGAGEGEIPRPTSQDPNADENEANSPPGENAPQELPPNESAPPDESAPQDESAPHELPPDGKTEAELLSSAEWGSIEHIDVAGEPIKNDLNWLSLPFLTCVAG